MVEERPATSSLVLVPGFAGLAWDTSWFDAWHHRIVVTGKLPDLPTIDKYASFVATWTAGLPHYVLVGDSFGALVALALAARRPPRLAGVVLSGAFLPADVRRWAEPVARAAVDGDSATYRAALQDSLRLLSRRMDTAESATHARRTIEAGCTPAVFARRAAMAMGFDGLEALRRLTVPTLVVSPYVGSQIVTISTPETDDGSAPRVHVLSGGFLTRFDTPAPYSVAIDSFVGTIGDAADAPLRTTPTLDSGWGTHRNAMP